MIKNISENILNKYFPNLSKEHKKMGHHFLMNCI